MYNLENKIKVLLTKNSESIEKLAVSINVSARTLHNIFTTNDSSTKVLKKIADYYNIEMVYFFAEGDMGSGPEIVHNGNGHVVKGNVNIGKSLADCEKDLQHALEKITMLEKLLVEKERYINSLERQLA